MNENVVLLTPQEAAKRLQKVQTLIRAQHLDAILVTDNANIFYLCGRVFAGMAYIPAEGQPAWLIRRPVELEGNRVAYIHRPENIPEHLEAFGIPMPHKLGLEFDLLPYSMATRLQAVFPEASTADCSALLRTARAVKTDEEIEQIRLSGVKHEEVYRKIPGLYTPGMTDVELQIEIERLSRLEGCLGMFRISGQSMEIFMGNVLTGKNADVPAPYDFAMGGRGLNPSIPGGAAGEEIKEHNAVMVDLNGNFTGYMTDMTRVFAVGSLPQEAIDAHQCSIDICRMFEREALPGVEAKALYEKALDMVKARGLEAYFMGHRQHAGFIGHGVGIEINELPVIAPRSKNILEENNVIALEPKFVIPGTGAVGIENTYVITRAGARCLTNAPEEIRTLE